MDFANSADSTILADSSASPLIPIIAETTFNFHEPYASKECDICHDKTAMGQLTDSQPDLCYMCHSDFTQEFNFLHGPVAGGYCTACHNPHMSKSKSLLIRTGQELCLYCHDSNQIYKNENHEGIEDYNCTECHNPHGGDNKYYY